MNALSGVYKSHAGRGESMTTAAIAIYAMDQIEQVRARLDQLR
jgi:hypothetical protein